jgi:hypothetical protein
VKLELCAVCGVLLEQRWMQQHQEQPRLSATASFMSLSMLQVELVIRILLPTVYDPFCCLQYKHEVGSLQQKLSGLTREELQRALGVKPMDKSSRSGAVKFVAAAFLQAVRHACAVVVRPCIGGLAIGCVASALQVV